MPLCSIVSLAFSPCVRVPPFFGARRLAKTQWRAAFSFLLLFLFFSLLLLLLLFFSLLLFCSFSLFFLKPSGRVLGNRTSNYNTKSEYKCQSKFDDFQNLFDFWRKRERERESSGQVDGHVALISFAASPITVGVIQGGNQQWSCPVLIFLSLDTALA